MSRNEAEKRLVFERLLKNEKIGLRRPLGQFKSLLQKGCFSYLYMKEKEVETKLADYSYKQAMLNGYKKYKKMLTYGYGQNQEKPAYTASSKATFNSSFKTR